MTSVPLVWTRAGNYLAGHNGDSFTIDHDNPIIQWGRGSTVNDPVAPGVPYPNFRLLALQFIMVPTALAVSRKARLTLRSSNGAVTEYVSTANVGASNNRLFTFTVGMSVTDPTATGVGGDTLRYSRECLPYEFVLMGEESAAGVSELELSILLGGLGDAFLGIDVLGVLEPS